MKKKYIRRLLSVHSISIPLVISLSSCIPSIVSIVLNPSTSHASTDKIIPSAEATTNAPASPSMPTGFDRGIAMLIPASGQKISGQVDFIETEGKTGIHVIATVSGLKPNTVHGFHIHEYGDCSSKTFDSAGGHFNPTQMTHGAPTQNSHHTGDLGNLTADTKGRASLDIMVQNAKLNDSNIGLSWIGRSVILHEKADDFTTQPSGNSGPRIACGVIGITKSK